MIVWPPHLYSYAKTSGGSRTKIGIFKPLWCARIGYLERLAIYGKPHCLQLHLHHHAPQSAKKIMLKSEAYCRAGATDSWPEQDNWCAPLSAQMNKHWRDYLRKFGKEGWGSKRSHSDDEEPDTKAPRAGWSEEWLLPFQRVKASTGQICSNFGKSRRLLHICT